MTGGELEVSVIVPTSNRWDLFQRAALESCLSQQDVDLELIVIDDASSDETPRRLSEFRDGRVRFIRNPTREGWGASRNTGIFAASGKWLAFLDDDDFWSPLNLRKKLDALVSRGADFVYSRSVVVSEQLEVMAEAATPDPDTLLFELRRGCVIGTAASNVVARTELLRQLGGFDPSLNLVDDWDMWLRLAKAGTATMVEDILVAYHHHGGNWLTNRHLEWEGIYRDLALIMDRHGFTDEERRAAGIEFDRWRAHGYRRAGQKVRAAATYLSSARVHRSLSQVPRAVGSLLGETAMQLGRQAERSVSEPQWLERYRLAGDPTSVTSNVTSL